MKTWLVGGVSLPVIACGLLSNANVALANTSEATTLTSGDVALQELPIAQPNDANSLLTQPRTLNSVFPQNRMPMGGVKQLNATIPSIRNQKRKPVTAAEVLTNPGVALEKFFNQKPKNPPAIKPLEFFEIPEMNTGVKMNLMKF